MPAKHALDPYRQMLCDILERGRFRTSRDKVHFSMEDPLPDMPA